MITRSATNPIRSSVGTAAATVVAAVGLLAGCSAASPPPVSIPSAPPAAASTAPPTSAPTPQGDATRNARPVAGQCRLDDLAVERAAGTYAAGTNHVSLVWTNRSQRTCTMDGFGGVDLLDRQGKRLSVARSAESAAVVTLAPGDRAHSTISYPAAGGTGVFTPATVLATPPNETRSARFPWGTGGIPTFEAPSGDEEVHLSPIRPGAS